MAATAVLAVGLLVASMIAYPGGTQWDRSTVGHDVWRNYVCDLARTVALNGRPNPVGSLLAQLAMAALAASLLQMWWHVAGLCGPRRALARAVRALGALAVAGALVATLLPADRFSAVHGAAIVMAGVPGLVGALLAIAGLSACEPAPRVATWVGAAALATSAVAFVIYVRQYFVPGPGPVAGAVTERIALLGLLGWMGAVAWRTSRR